MQPDKKTSDRAGHVAMTKHYGNIIVEICDDYCVSTSSEENAAIWQKIAYYAWQNKETAFLSKAEPKKEGEAEPT